MKEAGSSVFVSCNMFLLVSLMTGADASVSLWVFMPSFFFVEFLCVCCISEAKLSVSMWLAQWMRRVHVHPGGGSPLPDRARAAPHLSDSLLISSLPAKLTSGFSRRLSDRWLSCWLSMFELVSVTAASKKANISFWNICKDIDATFCSSLIFLDIPFKCCTCTPEKPSCACVLFYIYIYLHYLQTCIVHVFLHEFSSVIPQVFFVTFFRSLLPFLVFNCTCGEKP